MILIALSFITLTAARAAEPSIDCIQPLPGPVLTLQNALDRLQQCNPAILQARAALSAAQADILTADHYQNPVLAFGVSNINPKVGVGNGSLSERTVDSAVRIDQLFERGGKRAARRDAATAASVASRESLHDTELRSEEDVLEAYLNASAASAALDLLTQAASSYRQSAAAMTRRFEAGDVARVEVGRTELDAGRAEADATAAASALAQARADLAAALGAARIDDDLHLLSLEQVATRRMHQNASAPDVDEWVSQRSDVKAAVSRLDASRSSLALARATRVSDVDVTLGFDHWPVSPANTQGTGNSFTIGASFPLKLFDSGRGPVGHAVADVSAAEADLQRTQTSAAIEIRTAQAELTRAVALSDRYRTTLLPSANQILDAEELAFRRGGTGLLDLLDARRNARQVAVAAVAARRDAEIAAGRLALAAGREPLGLFLNGRQP